MCLERAELNCCIFKIVLHADTNTIRGKHKHLKIKQQLANFICSACRWKLKRSLRKTAGS